MTNFPQQLMENPRISQLRIYPIKSLDPIEKNEVEMGTYSIKGDREFAMIDMERNIINGKRTSQVYKLKAEYQLDNGVVTLSTRGESSSLDFELREENDVLNEFLSDFFGIKLKLIKNTQGQFQDMPVESSVTLLSDASLESLQNDLNLESLENLRLRFRANIEVTGVKPFWEEKLFYKPDEGVNFQIGEVKLIGISPRARCNVPPQNPSTGDLEKEFVKKMMGSRLKSLPEYSTIYLFGRNTYYLTVNSFLPLTERGKKIKIGDLVTVLDKIKLQ